VDTIVPRGTLYMKNLHLTYFTALLLSVQILFYSCQNIDQERKTEPLNIVWIVAEDLSPVIPSFGDSTIETPHISRLAEEGVCYDFVFSPSGVCSPSRAAIATGMYPTHIGANHMRTGPWFPGVTDAFIQSYAQNAMPPTVSPYEVVPPPEVIMLSEQLRAGGYYCTNNSKEDYQFAKSIMAWDESSSEAHWRNRKKNQPFFSVFNLNVTHESQIWSRSQDVLLVDENLKVKVPPYLPETDSVIMDLRRMYSNILLMDEQVGQILNELEKDDLLDNTIVFWYTDHGGPLPRQKRLVYDSGLKVPMIIRHPDLRKKGTRDSTMVSFIDLAPTVLSLAGIRPPDYLDGVAILGDYTTDKRRYIHAAADRFDEGPSDPIRAVRDHRWKYIRYYDTLSPMFYHVSYRDQMASMRSIYRLQKRDLLSDVQKLWLRPTKPTEELFDTWSDPHEIRDLADSEEYDSVKYRLKKELLAWEESFTDLNKWPESELIDFFWPNGVQPQTASPKIELSNDGLVLSSPTAGASIGYKWISDGDTSLTWIPYRAQIPESDSSLLVIAHRLGFRPSESLFIE